MIETLRDLQAKGQPLYIFIDGSVLKMTPYFEFFIGLETPCDARECKDKGDNDFILIEGAKLNGNLLDLNYFWDCKSVTFTDEEEETLNTLEIETIFKNDLKDYYYTYTEGGFGKFIDGFNEEQSKEIERRCKADPSIIIQSYIDFGKNQIQIDFDKIADLVG